MSELNRSRKLKSEIKRIKGEWSSDVKSDVLAHSIRNKEDERERARGDGRRKMMFFLAVTQPGNVAWSQAEAVNP